MRFIRLFLIWLAVATVLAALLVGVAFTPVVQTWFARRTLNGHPGWQVSVQSVSAGFSKVEFTNLRIERDGAVLTLPVLTAGLPLKTAVWDHQLVVGNLVAKGWTLDLSQPATASAGAEASRAAASPAGGEVPAPAQRAAQIFFAVLHRWQLPCDVALDGVDLDGEVLLASPAGQKPTRVQVTIKGGGLASGRPGDFAVETAASVVTSSLALKTFVAHGTLGVGMETPRTIDRIELKVALTSDRGSVPADLSMTLGVAPGSRAGEENYSLDLARGPRHVANIAAAFANGKPGVAGTWKLDLRDSDLAPFFPENPWPEIAAAGEGRFDSDATFATLHATGQLQTAAGRLEVFTPTFARLGNVTLETRFDVTHGGPSFRVDHLELSLGGTHPIAVAQAAQSFVVDERTWRVKPANAATDWLQGSLRGFPLAWLPPPPMEFSIAGGDATGDFTVTAGEGGEFALRSTVPLMASGVSVQRAGRMLGEGLDLSVALLADYAADRGWHAQAAPLTVSNAGRRLATADLKLSPVATGDPRIAFTGKWSADLDALATAPGVTAAHWIKGRSVSGDFSGKIATALEWSGKTSVIGHNPANVLTLGGSGYFDGHGAASFRVPVTIALGANASDFTADGQWIPGNSGTRVEIELTAVKVTLEHLGLLAGALPVAKGAAMARDQIPFWGDKTGTVKFDCYQLLVGAQELNEVSGTFEITRDAIRLRDAKAALAPPATTEKPDPYRRASAESTRSTITAEGGISFDAAAEFAYNLKATASIDGIDETRLFGMASANREAAIDGRCAVTDALTGAGANLAELIERRREEIHLTSKRGAVRFLKTSVAEAIPEKASPVSDDLSRVGGAVGNAVAALFGVHGKPALGSGQNPISPAADAVLNFTYGLGELSYDDLVITAVRGADGAIKLTDIAIDTANERLTGSGEIDPVAGKPLAARPLHLDLRLGVRGPVAASLAPTGLLAADKDAQGCPLFREPLHFGGTLEQIDATQWHALLAKAVAAPAAKAK